MTRSSAASVLLLACGVASAVLTGTRGQGASFTWGELKVTNIDPEHYSFDFATGKFSILGHPRLHATMSKKHLTVDSARLDGTADTTTKTMKTAKLSGGVKGQMESTTKDGDEHLSFAGPTVTYTSVGAATDQLADIDVSGGANFATSNASLGRTLSLSGSHGLFRVQSGDNAALQTADLDGPVTMHYDGVQVSVDRSKKPPVTSRSPVSGVAVGGHLTVSRAGNGNYLVRMSGGVHLKEVTGPNAGAEINTTAVNLEFDTSGTLVRFGSDAESTATVPVGKARG
ncbi:MAG TPA: hypothetical protein VKT78_04130 [Fimbriimonadaceae bacterium]|nr:hypothetical protein [Fimbriimonadaceae bacterium]